MPQEYNRDLIPRAQEMRSGMTPQEQHLWFGFLRSYPVRFRRQSVIYHYIADFYCSKARLVIEVDGGQHLNPDAVEYDRIRTETFEQLDLLVLRFTNDEVEQQFDLVKKRIDQTTKERLSLSSGCPPWGAGV